MVHVLDSVSRQYQAATNCAGNFFVLAEDFEPVWPVWIKIRYGGLEHPMDSPSYREGSCARCHADPPGPASVGRVYFAPPELELPTSSCP
jgi:hypothetical protein